MAPKPRGFASRALFIDAETTGFARGYDPAFNPETGETHQILSLGMAVVELPSFRVLETHYHEVKWNGKSKWTKEAEAIHGLTKEYLEQNGITEEELVVAIADVVIKHWGFDEPVILGGTNVMSFDKKFLEYLLTTYEVEIKISHRAIDTFGIGLVAFDAFNSDDLFKEVGVVRSHHNALEDVLASVKSCRMVRKAFQ